MIPFVSIDRIQFFGILFSAIILAGLFVFVKNRRIKEEYSLLWLVLCSIFLYLSLDRLAVDRLADLVGIAYKPGVLILIFIGFMTLILAHITIVITRLSDQNRELTQELALSALKSIVPNIDNPLVIVPAYNEEANILDVIRDLESIGRPLDIIVINDGSHDRTCDIASQYVNVINLPNNLGIGGAVQTGFKFACRHGYRTVIQFDGDGQHIAGEIPKLLNSLTEKDAQMIIGSRFLQAHNGFRSTFIRRIGILIFQMVNSLIIGQRITDNTSGFRAYNRLAITFLARHYPVDYPEPETVILLGKNGFQIGEVFTMMRERRAGGSSITGLTGAYYMIKVLLAIVMAAIRKPIDKRWCHDS
jgi:hypothetical protein